MQFNKGDYNVKGGVELFIFEKGKFLNEGGEEFSKDINLLWVNKELENVEGNCNDMVWANIDASNENIDTYLEIVVKG